MEKIKKIRISDLLGALQKKAPMDLAESWDNVGLLLGDSSQVVTGVVVSVNLGAESLEEAQKKNANVIVCHHPPIFKPIAKITSQSHPYVFQALQQGVSVIALHTNFDLVSENLCKDLSEKFNGIYDGPLARRGSEGIPSSVSLGKFITYVPTEAVDQVREAVAKAGGGVIGNYTQCSFSWEGEGTFLGGEGSHPTIGEAGQLEKVQERRLEMVFPWKHLDRIVESAQKVHPYEKMGYDIMHLKQSTRPLGYGFVAGLKAKSSCSDLIAQTKEIFQIPAGVMVLGRGRTLDSIVSKIAFSPGSGSAFIGAALAKGVDLYICGEMGYHQMLEAKRGGMSLFVLGHSNSERFFVETLAVWCNEVLEEFVQISRIFETVDFCV